MDRSPIEPPFLVHETYPAVPRCRFGDWGDKKDEASAWSYEEWHLVVRRGAVCGAVAGFWLCCGFGGKGEIGAKGRRCVRYHTLFS